MSFIEKNQHLRHAKTFKGVICGVLITALLAVGVLPLWAYKDYTAYPFEDAPEGHWAFWSVFFCWSRDIVEGVSDKEFSPDALLTRAQFITMMGRAVYEDEIQAQTVSSDSWYSGYVRYLSNNGYLDGIATDESSLNQSISRQEMALIMYNMCKDYNAELNFDYSNALSSVTDASSIGSNYTEAVKFCYYTGLLTGYEDGSFNPTAALTRAEATAVIKKTCHWVEIKDTSRTTLLDEGFPEEIVNQTFRNLVIENINDWREENGLKRLQTLEFMNEAATVRAEECSISFSHTRPDGSSCESVYDDLFKDQYAIGASGENIVMTYTLHNDTLSNMAYELVELWKESPGHNANMLGSLYNYIGAGVFFANTASYGTRIYSATHFCDGYGIFTNGTCEWIFPES